MFRVTIIISQFINEDFETIIYDQLTGKTLEDVRNTLKKIYNRVDEHINGLQ